MTEAEWNAGADATPMLEFLRGKASDRKLRLFASGCCRLIWRLLIDPRSRAVVEAVERLSDDPSRREDARLADRFGLRGWRWAGRLGEKYERAARAVRILGSVDTWNTIEHVMQFAEEAGRLDNPCLSAHPAMSNQLRDVFGPLPFRPVALDPSWIAWNDGAVRKLAQTIYDDRPFDRLPVLADALEEAGCTDAAILAHCRGSGEHMRGCWVVDLLLDKE